MAVYEAGVGPSNDLAKANDARPPGVVLTSANVNTFNIDRPMVQFIWFAGHW